MTANSFWGVPESSGMYYPNRPDASGIERTMFWLDRVAEQHAWTSHYNSDPIISVSGFNWKRHNGLELETFEPRDTPPFKLTGYPISTKDFWLNFRNIIGWAGDKIIQKWDLYGGQNNISSGSPYENWSHNPHLLGTQNISGINWNNQGTDKWINYGNYTRQTIQSPYDAGFLLNNSGETSFVNHTDSSKIDYIGRHGHISKTDYEQYIPFPLTRKGLTAYFYYDKKHVNVIKYLTKKNFNTVDTDLLISRNSYLTNSDLDSVKVAISGLWASGVGYSSIYNSGWSGDMYTINTYEEPTTPTSDETTRTFCGYNLIRKQAIDGVGYISAISSSGIYFTSAGGITTDYGNYGGYCDPIISGTVITYLTTPWRVATLPTLYQRGPSTQLFDVLDYSIDSLGQLSSYNINTVKSRITGGATREIESIEGTIHQTYIGSYFPLSTRYYSSTSGDRYYGNNSNYFRSFTGFTKEDTLDLVSILENYGVKGSVSGIMSYQTTAVINYNVHNVYGTSCPGTSFYHSSVTTYATGGPNPLIDIQSKYDLKLVYGFVEFPFNSGNNNQKIASVTNLITNSIDNGDYTTIINIDISGGYTSISFSPSYFISTDNGFAGIDVKGDPAITPTNPPQFGPGYYAMAATPYKDLFDDRLAYSLYSTNRGAFQNFKDYKKIGSLSGVVDIEPTGNILYLAIINNGNVLGDFMSESLPELKMMDEQNSTLQDTQYSITNPAASLSIMQDPYWPTTSVYPRFIGTAAGSYSYLLYDCPVTLVGDVEPASYGYRRVRSMGFKERSREIQFNPETSLKFTNQFQTLASGQARHSSYGAANSGENKYINGFGEITLYSDTTLWR